MPLIRVGSADFEQERGITWDPTRRGRHVVREAVLEARDDLDRAQEDLMDEMLSGQVAIAAVVAGLLQVVEDLMKLIDSGDISDVDLEARVRELLDG